MRLADFRAVLPAGDFWVFGYGSLMWSPCFAYRDRRRARVHGYHRALCILSTRYRGTPRKRGPCIDYIRNTLEHMHYVGVRDPHLERVLEAALSLRKAAPSACAPALGAGARAASRSSV